AEAVSAPGTLFVMMGDSPASYVVPFLPASDRVVRISANFPLQKKVGLGFLAAEMAIIDQYKGPIRSLTIGTVRSSDRFQLTRFGWDLHQPGCVTFRSRIDQFVSCPLVRSTVPPPLLAVDPQSQIILWNSPPYTSARIYVQ